MADGDGVEPAAAARPAGDGAIFLADLANAFADAAAGRRPVPSGNGPRPTRVVYALMTPMMRDRLRAGTPLPLQMPVVELFELVTYG